MKVSSPNRVTRTGRQRLRASPRRVFPLLCPVREVEWAVGWSPIEVFSVSGIAEPDCVFTTPEDSGTAIWYLTQHDPAAGFVEFVKVTPEVTACRIEVRLAADGNECIADVTYSHTSLGPRGDRLVAGFTEEHYRRFIEAWERELNHFLRTGEQLASSD